jgi:hypothetical protein
MFNKVNLEDALYRAREERRNAESEVVLEQFRDLFLADWEKERRIKNVIEKGCTSDELIDPYGLTEDRIFQLEHIKELAIKYRLRFLSTKHFKKDFPQEAISKIKEIENTAGQEVSALMILAPASMYKLQDANTDPLLFAPLADGRFYLIHQWGGDLSWYRAVLAWPLAKLPNLIATIAAISMLIALAMPVSIMSAESDRYFNFYRIAFFAWNILFISGFASYFWFATHQKFSVNAWNSKHFN